MEFEKLIASVTAISVPQSQVATDDKLLVFHSKTQLKGVPLCLESGHSALHHLQHALPKMHMA